MTVPGSGTLDTDRVTSYSERPTRSAGYVVAVVSLLFLHLVLVLGAFYLVGINGMNASMCGFYQGVGQCGDVKWVWVGLLLVMGGGGVLLLVNVIVSIVRIVKGANVIGFVVTMCVLQVLLTLVAVMMQGLAGPV